MVMTDRDILSKVYEAFNARDIDAVLAFMDPAVDWPNGMEGGRVHGHQGVREYWTRQWGLIDPHVVPERINGEGDGKLTVDVHQVVRDLAGNILVDRMVQHLYLMREGLITRMDIRE
jgi:hypothetical protein